MTASPEARPTDAPLGVPMVELRGVRAAYGRIEVLRGVDLTVPEGGVVALLGPNGAGKTTTINVVAGRLPSTGGQVLIAGRDVTGAEPDALARAGVCTVPEGRGVFPNLTVRENLRVATHSGAPFDEVEAASYARFPRLAERREQLAGTLSGGEQQMLALSRALATDPAVLILDELSMGLAPLIVDELYEAVLDCAATGVSILLAEQFARIALRVADIAAVMLDGRVVNAGPPSEIEDRVLDAYLGA